MPVLTKINTNSIAEDAITGDKFAGDAYLANTATQNISGTYSENRLYTSDAYTLSGNATVNSHLTLSSVKPTGDVVLTAGGAYTITGTGVLSGGSLLAKERSDLTGMTGELGSVVTGSPNLNLGNATFPTGTPIQYVTSRIEGGSRGHNTKTIGNRSEIWAGYRSSIIPKGANSKILIRYSSRTTYVNNVSAHWAIGYEVTALTGAATGSTLLNQLVAGEADDADSYFTTQHTTATYRALTMEVCHAPSYTVGQKIWYGVISYATGWHYLELHGDVDIVITEIVG